jgi:hypothetical protein
MNMTTKATEITNKQIRDCLGHGTGSRRVRITMTGEVHIYGSTDAADRSSDAWTYAGSRADIAHEIECVETVGYYSRDDRWGGTAAFASLEDAVQKAMELFGLGEDESREFCLDAEERTHHSINDAPVRCL